MDFLKSAVASAISKGPPFPYTFGDRIDVDQSIWTLYNGTKREDGSNCSIFSFDTTVNRSTLPLARNAVKKLRTLRHPGIVKVLDTVETETYIYVATERLVPLGWHVRRKSLSPETIKWGLYSVAKTVSFINDEASSVHGNVRVSSIYTAESGEWKVGGFEVLSSMRDEDAMIYNHGGLIPDSNRYAPPETTATGWSAIKKSPLTAPDAWDFGILIYEVFNGSFMGKDQLSQLKVVPPSMHLSLKRMTNIEPRHRLSVGHFFEQGKRTGGFLDIPLVKITEGIESLGVKSEGEREEFLSELDEVTDDFPEDFFKMKILPELLKSLEFGGGGPRVLGVVLRIGSKLTEEEYDTRITPVIVRLFSLPDRAMRVCLLENLPFMIDHLSQRVVNDKIFPQMVTGFTDLAPVVREQTVKAVLTIVVKLSDRTINGDLLRYLAKTSNDEQPGIRTNTTICLGKIARNIGASTRPKVLVAAFSRSLRDPFVHARNAALLALAATADVFTEDDCANKILPVIVPSLVDKEKLVRDQANKALDIYLTRVRKYAATLADSALPPSDATSAMTGQAPRMSTPQTENSWAGWAISSFTNKLTSATGDIQNIPPSKSIIASDHRSISAPPTQRNPSAPTTSSDLRRQALSPPSTSAGPFLPKTSSITNGASASWDDTPNDDIGTEAWGDMEDDSFFDAPTKPASPPIAFDDGGEPDFAGWLDAQAKSKEKKPLPKGLTKASAAASGRPSQVRSSTTGNLSKVVGVRKESVKAVEKKLDLKPKDEAEGEDDWGSAWD